jgi:hypothetical protein
MDRFIAAKDADRTAHRLRADFPYSIDPALYAPENSVRVCPGRSVVDRIASVERSGTRDGRDLYRTKYTARQRSRLGAVGVFVRALGTLHEWPAGPYTITVSRYNASDVRPERM